MSGPAPASFRGTVAQVFHPGGGGKPWRALVTELHAGIPFYVRAPHGAGIGRGAVVSVRGVRLAAAAEGLPDAVSVADGDAAGRLAMIASAACVSVARATDSGGAAGIAAARGLASETGALAIAAVAPEPLARATPLFREQGVPRPPHGVLIAGQDAAGRAVAARGCVPVSGPAAWPAERARARMACDGFAPRTALTWQAEAQIASIRAMALAQAPSGEQGTQREQARADAAALMAYILQTGDSGAAAVYTGQRAMAALSGQPARATGPACALAVREAAAMLGAGKAVPFRAVLARAAAAADATLLEDSRALLRILAAADGIQPRWRMLDAAAMAEILEAAARGESANARRCMALAAKAIPSAAFTPRELRYPASRRLALAVERGSLIAAAVCLGGDDEGSDGLLAAAAAAAAGALGSVLDRRAAAAVPSALGRRPLRRVAQAVRWATGAWCAAEAGSALIAAAVPGPLRRPRTPVAVECVLRHDRSAMAAGIARTGHPLRARRSDAAVPPGIAARRPNPFDLAAVERLDRFVSLAGRHSDLLAAATSLPSQALADKTARSEKALRAAALALLLDPADWREAGALAGKHLADTIVRVAMAGSGTAVQLAGDRDAVRGFQAHRALRLALGRHALWLAGDPAGARIDWTGQDLRRHRLAGEDLRGAIMGRADLQGMDLTGTRFDGAFLESAVLRGARIDRAVFSGARMAAADMRAIRGAAPVLSGAHLNCAQMQECVLEGASFGRANVSGASIARGALADADFTDADGLASLVTDGARLARAVGVAPATLQPAAQLT